MTDEAHGAACKLRLNQSMSSLTSCYCGHDLQNDPWHVLSHKGGGEAGRRHDEIVDRLVDAVHRAGGQAWAEPRQDFWQDRRRTDIFAVMGPKSYHIDVRVTHPTSTSYVTLACQGSLKAAEEAAQEKKRRYAALAHSEGATFVPFIVETFGGFGKDARTFIADLAKFAAVTSRVWSEAETRFMVRAEVQRALFEGNLRVANAVLQESNPIRYASGRYHAVPPRPRTAVHGDLNDEEEGFPVARSSQPRGIEAAPTSTRVSEGDVSVPVATAHTPVFYPSTPPRPTQARSQPSTPTAPVSTVPEQSHSQSLPLPQNQPTYASMAAGQGPVPLQLTPTSSSTTRALASGRQLTTPQRSFTGSQRTARRPRGPRDRCPRPSTQRDPLRPTTNRGATPSTNLQHHPQVQPYPPPIPPSYLQSQNNQTPATSQSLTTSSQTTSNHNRQSSTTLTTSTLSLNGIQTQTTSRTEGKVDSGTSSARTSSRDEALSFLDTIRPTVSSQATGTTTQNQSRSERSNWRSDGVRTTGTWSLGSGRRRGNNAGNGNTHANQVHTTTSRTGASQHR